MLNCEAIESLDRLLAQPKWEMSDKAESKS